ncbi:hypothetical protein [Paraburkholderia hospita]|uniref:hypothetical protein n=1 Tax=Paraburkholderia hospita TaxID=169430 RepID=UPI00103A5579|nr:hypothetical protein [Paraburkholderia hospita]
MASTKPSQPRRGFLLFGQLLVFNFHHLPLAYSAHLFNMPNNPIQPLLNNRMLVAHSYKNGFAGYPLMNKSIVPATLLSVLFVGCANPTRHTLSNPQQRHLDDKTALTDSGTARKCAENMLNASPASQAADVATRVARTGNGLIVDVDANLLDVGMFHESLPVGYRCTYEGDRLVRSTWTRGLKGD